MTKGFAGLKDNYMYTVVKSSALSGELIYNFLCILSIASITRGKTLKRHNIVLQKYLAVTYMYNVVMSLGIHVSPILFIKSSHILHLLFPHEPPLG